MNIDDRLRGALRPVAPPDGFADRVRARVARPTQARRARPRRPFSVPMALAASLAAVVLSSTAWLAHEQRVAREQAHEQLLTALRVTSHELRALETRLTPR